MEQQEFLFIASGKGGLYSYSGKQFGSFLQSKQTFTKWSRNHVGLKTYVHTKSAHEYIIFFSQSSKSGSNHNHNGLKKKSRGTFTQWNTTQQEKENKPNHRKAWKNLKNTLLSKRSQSDKET